MSSANTDKYAMPPTLSYEEEVEEMSNTVWKTLNEEEQAMVTTDVVEVAPLPADLIGGDTASTKVTSVKRPAMWFTPTGKSKGAGTEKAKEDESVIAHVFGAGFRGGHPAFIDSVHGIALSTGQRAFSTNYRKSTAPDRALPAPMLDTLAGFKHLTDECGFDPSKITLMGESAGGHTALMASRRLHELGLKQPGRIVLVSPWTNLTADRTDPSSSYITNKTKDNGINTERLEVSRKAATQHFTDEERKSKWLSPALAKPEDWLYLAKEKVQVYVTYDEDEMFRDDIIDTVKNMKEAGVEVGEYVTKGGYHASSSLEPERAEKSRDWLSKKLSSA